MYLDRMIFCVMTLFAIAPSYGMSELKIEQYSPDRSSSPLIGDIDWHERSWKAKKVLEETDKFMQSVHKQMRDSHVYCDPSESIEERTASDSASSTLSELSPDEDGYSIMYGIGDCTLRDANGTLSYMQEAERSAKSTFELTERIKANADHIDRVLANVFDNCVQCCEGCGTCLIGSTAGMAGTFMTVGGIMRMVHGSVDPTAVTVIGSGIVLTGLGSAVWLRYLRQPNGVRPVATHDV